jgi:dihydroflavonol-4-reductase
VDSDVERILGDVRDPDAVRSAVAGCDVVIHAAGCVDVWGAGLARMLEVHRDGTRNVIEAADPSATVVHTSSVVAVGALRGCAVLDENSPFELDHVRIDYVRAKREGERVALDGAATGRRVIVVNPGYLIGPEDYHRSVMGRLCCRFWEGHVLLAPPGGMNFVDVRDVATGHLLAAERGVPGRRYILGGANVSLKQFLLELARVAGLRPRALPRLPNWLVAVVAAVAELRGHFNGREPYPSMQQYRLGRYHWFYDSTRAQTELGFHARPLDETLADAYEWFRQYTHMRLRPLQQFWLRRAA